MLRILILTGFMFLFLHLHATGNISKYINMKYSYISFSAIFILGLLTIVQFYIYAKSDDETEHHDCTITDCGHDHHSKPSRIKSFTVHSILIFPIVSGLLFPITSLDSETVKTRGFHFKGIENEGDYGQHQFLKPDMSVFYGEDGYSKKMDQELKQFPKSDTIKLTDENFLKGIENIYYKPSQFVEKDIQLHGFTYNKEETSVNNNQMFLLRFGIIHCIADSGVFGMMVEFPKGTTFPNDKWIEVEGTISIEYYQPFKAKIPYIKVSRWKEIEKPEEEYVYRTD